MKVELAPGEKVEIVFADSDGSITVEFNALPNGSIRVRTDWPDSEGRVGVVYEEKFAEKEEH